MNISSEKLAPPLIFGYFALFFGGLYLVDWSQFTWLSALVTFYVALFLADFVSGLVHLFIDYQPLNYAKGYGELYDYKGKRNSDDFNTKKKRVFSSSTVFDREVYFFKIHHRNAGPCVNRPYRDFFFMTCVPATLFILLSIGLSISGIALSGVAYLSFALLVFSIGVLHTDHIHAWVHGSKTMPWGVAIARRVQKLRLMYSMKTHIRHHQEGESGFCFIIGHANFLVDAICRLLLRMGVIEKRHWFGERVER
ncbi:fatty acid desaturase CarF family protein [Marinobacterium mangrovicola]|uniref:TMEM189-like protein n=1 Tax=Marinobacterium mangrovicola TaxID=1476959 RepID=A0A4R1GQV0_9GAMM|nr:fatty acid desaturase CarF family protein [Marinobacterium mangrovicola]TCK09425.1 TMEM189-like protein [Marinobacterium mangrovicola]